VATVVASAAVLGVVGALVQVDLLRRLPATAIVGLAGTLLPGLRLVGPVDRVEGPFAGVGWGLGRFGDVPLALPTAARLRPGCRCRLDIRSPAPCPDGRTAGGCGAPGGFSSRTWSDHAHT
jgi:hypothetical protein